MEIIDYDEVYAYLSEKNFENIESLMIDIDNDQLLGENAFILDGLLQKMRVNTEYKKRINKTKKVVHPTNPIRI